MLVKLLVKHGYCESVCNPIDSFYLHVGSEINTYIGITS